MDVNEQGRLFNISLRHYFHHVYFSKTINIQRVIHILVTFHKSSNLFITITPSFHEKNSDNRNMNIQCWWIVISYGIWYIISHVMHVLIYVRYTVAPFFFDGVNGKSCIRCTVLSTHVILYETVYCWAQNWHFIW